MQRAGALWPPLDPNFKTSIRYQKSLNKQLIDITDLPLNPDISGSVNEEVRVKVEESNVETVELEEPTNLDVGTTANGSDDNR